eukprot:TRINITY_DN4934_c0_g1_i1.p2 TRINITY_DN4934_c0_g1~~TRINITY_DN4934_c0_g1_i1.p2  ORF type:complete len:230 (-),score=28.18 TRINITY_DN4934_c0_g1_i1:1246-1935(-)
MIKAIRGYLLSKTKAGNKQVQQLDPVKPSPERYQGNTIQQHNKLLEENTKLKKIAEEHDKLLAIFNDLQSSYKRMEEENKLLKNEATVLNMKLQNLNKEKSTLIDQTKILKDEKNALIEQSKAFENENVTLRVQNQKLAGSKKELIYTLQYEPLGVSQEIVPYETDMLCILPGNCKIPINYALLKYVGGDFTRKIIDPHVKAQVTTQQVSLPNMKPWQSLFQHSQGKIR